MATDMSRARRANTVLTEMLSQGNLELELDVLGIFGAGSTLTLMCGLIFCITMTFFCRSYHYVAHIRLYTAIAALPDYNHLLTCHEQCDWFSVFTTLTYYLRAHHGFCCR
jgi:hypothetical protein